MALIVYANLKGGVGKTTLAVHHAVHLFDKGHSVALIDADTLHLSSQWVRLVEPGIEVSQVDDPADAVHQVKELSSAFDYVIADCPGNTDLQTVSLIKRADLAVFPVMASALDLLASIQGATKLLKTIRTQNQGKPEARLVINGVDWRCKSIVTGVKKVVRRLEIPAAKTMLTRTVAMNDAFSHRSVVTRMGMRAFKSKQEVTKLFRELERELESPQKRSTRRRVANG